MVCYRQGLYAVKLHILSTLIHTFKHFQNIQIKPEDTLEKLKVGVAHIITDPQSFSVIHNRTFWGFNSNTDQTLILLK